MLSDLLKTGKAWRRERGREAGRETGKEAGRETDREAGRKAGRERGRERGRDADSDCDDEIEDFSVGTFLIMSSFSSSFFLFFPSYLSSSSFW